MVHAICWLCGLQGETLCCPATLPRLDHWDARWLWMWADQSGAYGLCSLRLFVKLAPWPGRCVTPRSVNRATRSSDRNITRRQATLLFCQMGRLVGYAIHSPTSPWAAMCISRHIRSLCRTRFPTGDSQPAMSNGSGTTALIDKRPLAVPRCPCHPQIHS